MKPLEVKAYAIPHLKSLISKKSPIVGKSVAALIMSTTVHNYLFYFIKENLRFHLNTSSCMHKAY